MANHGEFRMRAVLFLCGLAFSGLLGLALSLGSAPAAESGWCSETRVQGPGQEYQVGLPAGWRVESEAGATTVRKDPHTLAFVYRVLAGDPPPPRLMLERVRALAGLSGAEMEVDGGRLQGHAGPVALTGQLIVEVHGTDLVLAGGWAPTSDWSAVQAKVEEVGRCYRRSGGTSG